MAEPVLQTTFAPLPTTQRGYGLHLHVHQKDGRLLYGAGRLVILRSIAQPTDVLIFTEHKANVNVAVPSPNGNWIASGDDDGNVLIWSYPHLKLKTQYKVGKTIKDIDWDADGTRLVCAGDGTNKAKVISWDSGNSLGEITMHDKLIISCAYRKHRPFRVATASEDLSINFYEGPPFKYKDSYRSHSRYPNCVRYSPDGELLASAGADMRVVFFDAKTYEVKREITADSENAHKGAIYALAWAHDNKSVYTASADKTIKQWSVDGSCLETWTIGENILDQQVGVAVSSSGVLSVSLSGAINYLEPGQAKPVQVLVGHQTTIQSMVVDARDSRIITAALSGEVCVWQRSGTSHWIEGKGHGGKVVAALSMGEQSSSLLSFGLDDKFLINDLGGGSFSEEGIGLGGQPVKAVTAVEGGLTVAILAQDKCVLIRGQQVTPVPLSYTPTAVAISNDSKTVFIGGKDKKLRVYTVSGDVLTCVKELDTHLKPITAISVSSDRTKVVSVDTEASIFIHTCDDYACLNKSGWRFHQAGIQDCAFSPDSQKIATVSRDNSLIVWEDVTGQDSSKRRKVANAHSQSVDGVAWFDNNTIVTYSADKTIKIWTL